MIEYKQGQNVRALVRLVDPSGNPVASKTHTSVIATVLRSDGSTVELVVDEEDWTEITNGGFTGEGVYTLRIPASATNLPGLLSYAVKVAGAMTYIGAVKVVANEEADTFERIGAPAGATISADIAAAKSDTGSIKAKTDNLPADPASNTQVATRAAPGDTMSLSAAAVRSVWDEVNTSDTHNAPNSVAVQLRSLREPVFGEVALNHDFGGTDALQAQDPSGQPVAGASVKVFSSSQWAAQDLSTPIGVSSTDVNGRWTQPIFVPRGATYYVQFFLAYAFGPNVITVTIPE